MKKSAFNAFRKGPENPSEKTSRSRKKRVFSASYSAGRSYSGGEPKKKFAFSGFKMPKLSKKVLTSVVAIAIVAVTVPVIFATAANSNEVAKIAEISLDPAPSTDVQDDTSDLFEGVSESPSADEALDATTEGELTSELTDSVTDGAAETQAQDAATATPVPTQDPTSLYTTFSSGMEDPFVSIIQGRLMDLDYMEPDEPTNLFGPITSLGIQYFQRKNGLPVDGVAGPETQALLFSEDALYYTVSEGADGLDVESIQERLEELGYPVSSTGYFGTETTSAVQYFQRMNGLTDDGNVGSETREMLYSTEAEPAAEKRSSSSSSSSSGSSESSGGSSGSAPAANPGSVEAFIAAAEAQLGDPYVRGGKGPDSFDCSGFVYYALNASGNGIGYMTSGGWASSGYTRIGSISELQRGDIICVSGHVAIYLGGGSLIHASSSNGAVVYGNINSNYWSSNWICGRRPL